MTFPILLIFLPSVHEWISPFHYLKTNLAKMFYSKDDTLFYIYHLFCLRIFHFNRFHNQPNQKSRTKPKFNLDGNRKPVLLKKEN